MPDDAEPSFPSGAVGHDHFEQTEGLTEGALYAASMRDFNTIIARFDVVGWDPAELPGIEGDWVGGVTMKKTYTSGITGSSVAHFLSSGEEGARGYLAAERITGSLGDGRHGAFTVHHGGIQSGEGGSTFGHIIPGSGTDDFAGFAGGAIISHDDGGAFFTFSLTR